MLRDVGKKYRTFSTMLMLRERSFRPQIKVIPKNMLVLLTLKPGPHCTTFQVSDALEPFTIQNSLVAAAAWVFTLQYSSERGVFIRHGSLHQEA